MPITEASLDEFATCEMERANELAKSFRCEINAPLNAFRGPPLVEFCKGRLGGGKNFSKYFHRIEKLRLLLDCGADVNAISAGLSAEFALDRALAAGAGIEFIEALLDANADINLADDKGNTVLFQAVESRKLAELGFLVERGGDINHKNRYERTVLNEEISRDDSSIDVVNRLIQLGADINATRSLHTSLWAVPNKSDGKKDPKFAKALQILELLIEKRADASAVNHAGESSLAIAVSNPNCPESIFEALVGLGAAIDSKDHQGRTPLLQAAAHGNVVATKFLLERGASVIHQDAEGKSALHWCCKSGHPAIVPLLINAGADMNLGDKKISDRSQSAGSQTPLMYAASNSEEVTKALLKFGPDVNLVDEAKQSALIHAIRGYPSNQLSIVERLLKNGARVDQSDHEGNTALHFMVQRGGLSSSLELIEALIEAGSDVNAQNLAGETPLILCRDSKSVDLLIKAGSSVNAVDRHGKSALIHCADSYSSDSDVLKKMKTLLKANCDLDIQDSEGKTALMHAVKSDGRVKWVRLLIDHGANLDLIDNEGRPAFAFADPENSMLLIEAGAKPSAYEGGALDNAVYSDNLPLATVLFERGAQIKLRNLARFHKYKKTLEKLARANVDLVRLGVICADPETQEQLDKLLSKYQKSPDIADDLDLPEILRKDVWPIGVPSRKQRVLSSDRIDEITKSVDYFKGSIHWPEGRKESLLQEFHRYSSSKNPKPPTASHESPQNYMEGLLKKKGVISIAALFKNWESESDVVFAKFWNTNAAELERRIYSLTGEFIGYLLARFDAAVLPGILDTQKKSSNYIDALLFVEVAACANIMCREMASGSCARSARQWVLRYPESCAKGVIVDAVGKPGKSRIAAEACLRFLAHNGHKSVVENVATQLGADVTEAVSEILAQNHYADFMPDKEPRLPSFWSADAYPRPRLKSNKKALPSYAIDVISSMMSISGAEVRTPALDTVISVCEPDSLARFAWAAFEEWAAKGQKDSDWIFESLSYFGDDACARRLTPYIRNWPRENGIARARKGLEILAAMGSDVALSQIQAIAQKNKYQSVLESAQEMMKRIAVARDLSPQQLEDRLVPDFGLSDAGEIKLAFGGRSFVGTVNARLQPVLKDESGAVLKALPSALKDDDKELANESTATWNDLCKELRPVAKLQLERLELAMVNFRRWTGSDFKTLFVASPLLQNAVKGLVWGVFSSKSKLSATFRVDYKNTFENADGEPIKLADGSMIGIAHPLQMDERTLLSWQTLFAQHKQAQPFAQLGRKTYRAIDDLEKNRFGLQGATVASKALKGLLAMGWSTDIGDAGWIWNFVRRFSSERVWLSVEPGVHINDYEMNSDTQRISVDIPDALNPIEFSELVRELMTLRK